MLSREEKEARRQQHSERTVGPFGEVALLWLTRAMRGAYLSIIADRRLIENSENDFPQLSPLDRELYLNYLHLDAMAKTVTIIESFLALCYVIAFKRRTTARSLARYPSMIEEVLPQLDGRILGSTRDHTIAEILSLPGVDAIGVLDGEERALIEKLTALTIEKFADDYGALRSFYESHLVPYNKMRHGMAVILGLRSNLQRATFAIDSIKRMARKPPNLVEIDGPFPLGNILAIVPADERSLTLYEGLARETDLYARYLVGSLLAQICNAGEGYLPCVMQNEQEWTLAYIPKHPMTPEEKKVFERIVEKLRSNFVFPSTKAHIEFRFGSKSDPQIRAHFEKFYSAIVRYSGKGIESSYHCRWTRP